MFSCVSVLITAGSTTRSWLCLGSSKWLDSRLCQASAESRCRWKLVPPARAYEWFAQDELAPLVVNSVHPAPTHHNFVLVVSNVKIFLDAIPCSDFDASSLVGRYPLHLDDRVIRLTISAIANVDVHGWISTGWLHLHATSTTQIKEEHYHK